jgi:hypothetical protein
MTGAFSSFGRTGASSETILETVLTSLNDARGTAYSKERGTVVWAENYALAKAIASVWEANRRLANQFDPARMSAFLPRWEKILGIVPAPSDSLKTRKDRVAFKLSLWSKEPTGTNLIELVKAKIGDLYVGITHILSTQNTGSIPGGLTSPGGVTLPDGEWGSDISYVGIRVWQPRTSADAKLITDGEFYDRVKNYKPIYDDHAPAYVTHNWHRFGYVLPGTVSAALGTNLITGVSTTFQSAVDPVVPGDILEIVDNDGTRRDFTVLSVSSDTNLRITTTFPTPLVAVKVYVGGFVLDADLNVDNCAPDS